MDNASRVSLESAASDLPLQEVDFKPSARHFRNGGSAQRNVLRDCLLGREKIFLTAFFVMSTIQWALVVYSWRRDLGQIPLSEAHGLVPECRYLLIHDDDLKPKY